MEMLRGKMEDNMLFTLKYVGEMKLQDKSGMWRDELSQKAALDIKQKIWWGTTAFQSISNRWLESFQTDVVLVLSTKAEPEW